MKKLIKELMILCPGTLFIEIDLPKRFNETVEKYMFDNPKLFRDTSPDVCDRMKAINTIIRVEATPINKPMQAESYHYDIESALQDCLNQIKLWQPNEKR